MSEATVGPADFSSLLEVFKRSIEADKLNWAALDFFDRAPAPFWIKALAPDGSLRLIRVNRAFEVQVGVSRSAAEGVDERDLWGVEDARLIQANDRHVMATGSAVHLVEEARCPSGVRRWRVWKWPIMDGAGQVIAVAGMAEAIA